MKHRVGQQQPHGHAGLHPACLKAAPAGLAMLHRHQHCAAPLAAHAEALEEPQQHEQDGSCDADLAIGGQQPDAKGGHAHDHEGGHQHGLAPQLVAIMAEHDASQRPGDEAHRIGGKRRRRTRHRVEIGKEQLVEHQCRRRAVQEEIVPFDGGADEAGENHAADVWGGRGVHYATVAETCGADQLANRFLQAVPRTRQQVETPASAFQIACGHFESGTLVWLPS